jgi:hypothetical protein
VIETALHQHFLMDHLPSITDCDKDTSPSQFLLNLVFNTLKN